MTGDHLNRRSFIRKSAAGELALGFAGGPSPDMILQTAVPKIKDYRKLGRTGAMVSDIGSGVPYSEPVLKAVIDSGVNFIETAETYDNGKNESLIGRVIKGLERSRKSYLRGYTV